MVDRFEIQMTLSKKVIKIRKMGGSNYGRKY